MKKTLAAIAIAAVVCLTPLSTAKAFDFCTTGLNLNFCGSVTVNAVSANGGTSTLVTITVLNTSGIAAPFDGCVTGTCGNPLAVFTAIGLTDVSAIGTLSGFSVTTTNLQNFTTNWALETNKVIGGGISVDILSSTTNGINYGLSSYCSGAPTPNAIYTGGAGINGPCGLNYVTFSFTSSTDFADWSAGDVFIKAQGAGFSSDCDFTLPNGTPSSCGNTVPEPASIVLVGTGLIALGRRASRWRRRNQNA